MSKEYDCEYECQMCGSHNMWLMSEYDDEDDGIPIYSERYFCDNCGEINLFENGDPIGLEH